MEKFVIIDGNSLINRAFYALPPLRTSDGVNCNAVYGFCNIFAKILIDVKPKYVCVAFDAGRHTFRNDIYDQYKANRKGMPDELALQMPILKNVLRIMGVKILEQVGIEADDIIGTLSRKFEDLNNIIVTGDRDALQLINANTEVWLTKQGITKIDVMNETTFPEAWGGMEPKQIVDLKALMGDSSDNIPGVTGVGEKTAMDLIARFQSIDNLYSKIDEINGKLQQKLIDDKKMCYLSYDLATIRCNENIDINKEDILVKFPWGKEVFEEFNRLEFRSLVKKSELFSISEEEDEESSINLQTVDFYSVENLLKKYSKMDKMAICITDNAVHFGFDKTENFVIDLLGVSPEMVVDKLRSIFEDESKEILAYGLKTVYKFLDICKINLRAKVYDVALAVYLCNSNLKEDKPEILLEHYKINTNCKASGLFYVWEDAEQGLRNKGLVDLYLNLELPLVKILYKMEQAGVNINLDFLRILEPKYRQEIEEIRQRVVRLAGEEFNLNSPKQLGVILFEKLRLNDFKNSKHSTSVEVLESLKYEHPIIDEILRYRTVMKLYSTYIEGIRQYVQSDGKVHTKFNQTMTVTGRLSSNEPNLQNIPVRTEEGKELRKLFVASKGCKLVSADYSQIELRLLAHFSEDPVLVEAYRTGKDIHATTASQIFGVPIEEVTPQQRRSAKAVNFGIIYGISPFGLASSLGISSAQAKDYIERYFYIYPTIKEFLNSSVQEYRQNNRVTTLFGRIRNFDNIVQTARDMRFGERAAMNMPLQGTASDIIKLAMLRVDEKITQKNLKAKLILQIHDELIFDVPEEEVDEVVQIVRECMENVVKLLVPLTVEIGVGNSWYDI